MATLKRVITKSKSGHYTATLNNLNGWHVYKAVKLASLQTARNLLNAAEQAIASGSYKHSVMQGDFVMTRIERLQEMAG